MRRAGAQALAVVLALTLLVALAGMIRREHADSVRELQERFDTRAEIASRFLGSYVRDLGVQQERAASRMLAGRNVSQRTFASTVEALGLEAAVLLDERGHALRVYPPSRDVVGADLGRRYDHLRRAVAGDVAVSDVVASAARSQPVVGLAVPFQTPHGRRVFSGGIVLSTSSLGTSYLRNVSPLAGATVWLIDSSGNTLATSRSTDASPGLMLERDAALAEALTRRSGGVYERGGERTSFAAVEIAGTPWRLVVAAPDASVFGPVQGAATVVPWVVFAALCLATVVVGALMRRLAQHRAREIDELGELALTDTTTKLYNRRGYELLAGQLVRAAARNGALVAVCAFDLDGLKLINDHLGHADGDAAIGAAARVLRTTFREADVVARVGGDEFLVAMAVDEPEDANAAIERVQEAVRAFNETEPAPFILRISAGAAVSDAGDEVSLSGLQHLADERMYAHKRARRPEHT
jgi:diguanylate cyclase (GGDEF)-like protein